MRNAVRIRAWAWRFVWLIGCLAYVGLLSRSIDWFDDSTWAVALPIVVLIVCGVSVAFAASYSAQERKTLEDSPGAVTFVMPVYPENLEQLDALGTLVSRTGPALRPNWNYTVAVDHGGVSFYGGVFRPKRLAQIQARPIAVRQVRVPIQIWKLNCIEIDLHSESPAAGQPSLVDLYPAEKWLFFQTPFRYRIRRAVLARIQSLSEINAPSVKPLS